MAAVAMETVILLDFFFLEVAMKNLSTQNTGAINMNILPKFELHRSTGYGFIILLRKRQRIAQISITEQW